MGVQVHITHDFCGIAVLNSAGHGIEPARKFVTAKLRIRQQISKLRSNATIAFYPLTMLCCNNSCLVSKIVVVEGDCNLLRPVGVQSNGLRKCEGIQVYFRTAFILRDVPAIKGIAIADRVGKPCDFPVYRLPGDIGACAIVEIKRNGIASLCPLGINSGGLVELLPQIAFIASTVWICVPAAKFMGLPYRS